MERGRYNGYRGRSGVQKVLLGFVSVLAVLVVLMALVLVLGQRYIYYGADGVHLDLPFLNRQPVTPPDVSHVVVEVLPPAPKEPDLSGQDSGDVSAEGAVQPDSSAGGAEETE
ncbi:MAG: hypothetical protein IJA11_07655 [Oscillospiraceae bacterium]|nr:hypothetical protein [Oscillospiraceae bacterium]